MGPRGLIFGLVHVPSDRHCDLRLAGTGRLLLPLRPQGFDSDASRKIAREKGQELFPNQRFWQAVITAAEDPRTWGLVALYFVSFGGFLALTAWFPTYWINLHHMDVKSAAISAAPLSSSRRDHWRVRRHALRTHWRRADRGPGLRGRLIGALILTFVVDFYQALGGELLIALGMGIGNAAVFKMVPKYVPEAVGGAAGIVADSVRSEVSSFRHFSGQSSMRSEHRVTPAASLPMSCLR